MVRDPSVLVVDDEDVILEGCRRILTREGFRVEKSNDAREGLRLAEQKDYDAILLDLKMPTIDGLQFLRRLRGSKPDVPVIIMTGYPSIPSAASAIRLGVSDYVTKPFTPEEISQAVHDTLRRHDSTSTEQGEDEPVVAATTAGEPWVPACEQYRFFDESWFQLGEDGTVRAGAMVPRSQGQNYQGIRLPRIGQAVHQGLPLAGLTIAGTTQRTVPAPVSGVVVAVNPLLEQSLCSLWDAPFSDGWIADISPVDLDKESGKCKIREVVLVNADQSSARDQRERLSSLGCQVRVAGSWEALELLLADQDCGVLMIDATSLAETGPKLVLRSNVLAPSKKIVVLASADSRWEAAYRESGIFYYAVEPFEDCEIIEILDAAFPRRAESLPGKQRDNGPFESVSSIYATNRHGTKVCLLAPGGLLAKDEGVGWLLRQKLLERFHPIETTLGNGSLDRVKLQKASSTCDCLLVLSAKDTGRLSGSLVRDTKCEFVPVTEENRGKVMSLVVQPDDASDGLAGLDYRTAEALADHVANVMASR